MRFPTLRAYTRALRSPENEDLVPGFALETVDHNGTSYPWHKGGRAPVFRLQGPGGVRRLVKVYLRGSPDAVRSRLEAVDKAVKRLAKSLPALVPFEYRPEGIALEDGTRWPALVMPYIESVTLGERVGELAAQGDRRGLARLAVSVGQLCTALEREGVNHGDFDTGNILVEPDGTLRLIDLDGLYAKETARLGACERGKANFVSPQRNDQWGPWVDRFSHWLIYASLLALAMKPSLWGMNRGDEELLFTADDFVGKGDRLDVLRAQPNAILNALAGLLERLWRYPYDERFPPLGPGRMGLGAAVRAWADGSLLQAEAEILQTVNIPRPTSQPGVRLLEPREEVRWWEKKRSSASKARSGSHPMHPRERRWGAGIGGKS